MKFDVKKLETSLFIYLVILNLIGADQSDGRMDRQNGLWQYCSQSVRCVLKISRCITQTVNNSTAYNANYLTRHLLQSVNVEPSDSKTEPNNFV